MMKWSRRSLLLLLLMAGWSAVAGLDEGISAYNSGDYATALDEFQVLAERGDSKAQLMLGLMFDNGLGAAQDYNIAFIWYKKAAEQGSGRAQFNVGLMYSLGQGSVPSVDQAVYWFQKAANNGFAEAQYQLGIALAMGRGIQRNVVEAYKWFTIAARQPVDGSALAITERDRLAQNMTADQVAEAEALAIAWLRRQQKLKEREATEKLI